MTTQRPDVVEATARWLESAGFQGDLAAITAGLHDFAESLEKIQACLLPSLLRLEPSQRDEALGIVVDLIVELEHVGRHIDDTIESLVGVREFLDESPRSGG